MWWMIFKIAFLFAVPAAAGTVFCVKDTKMDVFFSQNHVIDEKGRKGYNKESP
jgi:hypothetical protein